MAGLKQGASRSPQDAGRSSLVISLRACAPGWEMAGPSLSQVRGEGGGRARRACSRGSWMGDGRPSPSGLWRGWRLGTEGTQQSRVVESRVVRGWLLPPWLCSAVCPRSSQMVVWLPRSALPRAVTRYVLSGLWEQKAE